MTILPASQYPTVFIINGYRQPQPQIQPPPPAPQGLPPSLSSFSLPCPPSTLLLQHTEALLQEGGGH